MPETTHSHAGHRHAVESVGREVMAALRRCHARGIHPATIHYAALAELATFRVEHMTPEDREAEARHPTARMGGTELEATVAARLAEGWPADGKPLA